MRMATNMLSREYGSAPEMLNEPLPVVMRTDLENRQRLLEYWLAPPSKPDLARMASSILGLLGAFPAASSGAPETAATKYVQILDDLPLWAVESACNAIGDGTVDGVSLDFRPAAPRVRQVAVAQMQPWKEELFNLRRVLTAKAMEPQDEAMRERLKTLTAEFADNFRMGKFRKESP